MISKTLILGDVIGWDGTASDEDHQEQGTLPPQKEAGDGGSCPPAVSQ